MLPKLGNAPHSAERTQKFLDSLNTFDMLGDNRIDLSRKNTKEINDSSLYVLAAPQKLEERKRKFGSIATVGSETIVIPPSQSDHPVGSVSLPTRNEKVIRSLNSPLPSSNKRASNSTERSRRNESKSSSRSVITTRRDSRGRSAKSTRTVIITRKF